MSYTPQQQSSEQQLSEPITLPGPSFCDHGDPPSSFHSCAPQKCQDIHSQHSGQPGQPPLQLKSDPQQQPDQPPLQPKSDEPALRQKPGQLPPESKSDDPAPQQQPDQPPPRPKSDEPALQQQPGQPPPQSKSDKPSSQQQPDQPPPQPKSDEPALQQQPGQPPPQSKSDKPSPQQQPDQPPPRPKSDEPALQQQPGQPPPHSKSDKPSPRQQPDQPPPRPKSDEPALQQQPGQPPPRPKSDEPALQQQPGQPPPQSKSDKPSPQQQPDQPPPQPKSDEPALQQQPGQPPPQSKSDKPSPQQQPDQPPPQPKSDEPALQQQPSQPPPQSKSDKPSPQQQPDQPPPQPKSDEPASQQQPGQPPPQLKFDEPALQQQPGQPLPQSKSDDPSPQQQPCQPPPESKSDDSSPDQRPPLPVSDKPTLQQHPGQPPPHSKSDKPSPQQQPCQPPPQLKSDKPASQQQPDQSSLLLYFSQLGANAASSPQSSSHCVPILQPPDSKTTIELLCPEKPSSQQQSDYLDVMKESQLGPSEERVGYSTPENEDHIFTETKTRTNEDVSQALPDTIDVSRGQHDYSQHFTPELKGLQSPVENSVPITFHVLVPLLLWDWDFSSHMHIRFGHKDLGSWEENCGDMTVHRDLGNGWCEMACTLNIDAEILRSSIPYIYIVYSPKMKQLCDGYEYHQSNTTRCLLVNMAKYQESHGGPYHQYDSIVYPKHIKTHDTVVYPKDFKPSKSFFGRTKKKAKSFAAFLGFGSSSKPQEEENILSPLDMGRLCLQVYLDEYKQMLCCGSFPQEANLKAIAREICHIFHCLHCPIICDENSSRPLTQSLGGKFIEVMKGWLESVVDALQAGAAENTMKQLASALCVTHCLHLLKLFDNLDLNLKIDKLALSLIRMLHLKPDLEGKECLGYNYVCDLLPKKCRTKVASSVALLCKQTRKGKLRECSWLLALPLYHFLKGFSEPFQTPVVDPEKIFFNQEKELDLDGFKYQMYSEKGFIVEKFDKFEDLFILDPSLLQVFVYICPKKDLPALFERIPPVLSTAWLIRMVSGVSTGLFSKNEAKEWIGWLCQIQQLTAKSAQEDVKIDPQIAVSMVTAALLLYGELTAKLKSRSPHHVDVLKASISLILFSVAQLKVLFSGDETDEIINGTFVVLKDTLWTWIVDRDVIGGSVFGGCLPLDYSAIVKWKPSEELELWQSFLTLECPPDRQVTEEWYRIANSHIRKRLNEVPGKWKIDLVCLLEKHENIHTILTDALMDVGTVAVDTIFSQQAEQDFERLAATKSAYVGKLLGDLMMKKYPNLDMEIRITFDDVLQWSLWPNFIKLYGSESRLKEGLPQECQEACLCALSALQGVCYCMKMRSITVTELTKIKGRHGQLRRLCEAATAHGENMELSYEAVDSAFSQIIEEFDAFEEYRFYLSHLCSKLNTPKVQDLRRLKQELERDFSMEEIQTLCVRENQNIRILLFQSADSLSAFAHKFYIMDHEHSNEIFTMKWNGAISAAVNNNPGASLTLADIYSKVWDPAFQSCQILLHELHDRSMKLSDINKRFKSLSDTNKRFKSRNLEKQLRELFAGVNACLGERKSGAWIGEVVRRIHDYWDLCNNHKAASAFLDLKEALNLQKGDFSNIAKLATEVSVFVKNETLETMDEKLVNAGKFLQDIGSDPRKLKCLESFADCKAVIKWLRDVTRDVNDLQNFVNVALATAAGGEDDLTHDKLSELRTVGSVFGTLIYNLPENTGYEDLAKRWESLWESLKNHPDLPNKLVRCNQWLEWYKSVKETHGSVEATSYGRMRNILQYGRYRVGSSSQQTAHSIHDMIHLKLENTGKQLPQTNFSLDDLRDLESKLMLITGSRSENRKEVDQFLNTLHSVCRITEVLLELQQKGNVKYTGWILTFHCRVDMVNALQQQAKDMEKELQIWEEEVQQVRNKYYELNYYTTVQLLALCKELGRLKTFSQPHFCTEISPHILALLESISAEMSLPYIWEAVTGRQQTEEAAIFFTHTFSNRTTSPTLKVLQNVQPNQPQRTVFHYTRHNMKRLTSNVPQNVKLNQPQRTVSWPTLAWLGLALLGLALLGLTWFVFSPTSLVLCVLTVIVLACLKFSPASASANTHTSASTSHTTLQQPVLAQDQFHEKQEETFDNLTNSDYPKQPTLILLEDQHEAENWITSPYGSSDVESMKSESGTVPGSKQSMIPEAVTLQFPNASNATSTPPELKETSIPKMDDSPKIESLTTQIQPVDEFHPTVQELIEVGYSVKQSVEAVKHHEGLEEAMDYLLSLAKEGGVFQPSKSDEGHQERGINLVTETQQETAMDEDTTLTILWDEDAKRQYLMLPELGKVLQKLRRALPAAVSSPRHFPSDILELGAPNLLVTTPEKVLRTALALYMDGGDMTLPLPTHEEVLICNQTTTTEEVTLLWQRAIGDPGHKRIFCLLHAEKLSYQVCDLALQSLSELSQGKKQDYRLVIICSNENEDKSHIISQLSTYRKHFPVVYNVAKYREYLKTHFTCTTRTYQSISVRQQVAASTIADYENSCVRVVTSTRSGMGKSLYITRMAEKLEMYNYTGTVHVTIPIHGPEVKPDIIMEFLKDHMKDATPTIFHFDIAPTILWKVDTILFSLLVLRGLSDSQGRVWKCHPTQLYAIEVTLPEHSEQQAGQHVIPESCTLALLDLLPSVECLSPRNALKLMNTRAENTFKVVMDRQEFKSSHCQRVHQYLWRHIANNDLDQFSYTGKVEGNPADCLETILNSCGLHDPSWSEIRHFVKFLDIQLQSCEASVFCDRTLVGNVLEGLKGFVVKFMVRMSRDFATSSLHGEVVREEAIGPEVLEEGDLQQYQILERRCWEHKSHPYIFFNQDRTSITFVGFMVTQNGDLIDHTHREVLEKSIMTQQLYSGLKANKVNFEENYRAWEKETMIKKITMVMGVKFSYDPDKSYVLTADNLIKILAIQMRFRCGIPVVIMGETGCGKTRLIRYMCNLARQGMTKINNMLIMKVHGGITESDITKFVENAEKEAMRNSRHKLDTVVFFDEANTTDAIGLIKEIMCDHRLHGKHISRDLKFIAACNPYRKHSEEMIEKLESTGLGFYVKATETQQKIGRIPLRQLVYRVLDLPTSMRPLVYDFGQLNTQTEEDYTNQIVLDHVKKHPVLRKQQAIIPAVARVLAWSQSYMRQRKDECSFVSLRDVERAMIIFEYFFNKMNIFGPKMNSRMEDMEDILASQASFPDTITRSLLLAISVCYHARLQDRKNYEEGVAAEFTPPLRLPGGAAQFRNEVQCCQEVLLDSMILGPNIARNAALRENVFMIAICIELRIPLFLVGKPGSSKSLAKSIVQTSMQGAASITELLRGFKQVHMFSYQCSQLSTPESVIEVFNTAKKFQKTVDTSKYVSVVVLDEVGLAEDSPNLPLKALHPLLEDGTEGTDNNCVSIPREERVAFIGISNWALDPAKMNRGIMVTRGDPDARELQLSARGICSNKEDDPVKGMLEPYFECLAGAYLKICKNQKREFFGLRDFYCLVKMLYWMCEKSGLPPTWPQLKHAICRNFGGMESDELDTLEEFKQQIHVRQTPDLQSIPEKLHSIVNPDCSRLGLIKTSLMTKETSWHGENRYLLFLTENYAALEILRHYLYDVVRSSSLATATPGDCESSERLLGRVEPFILFGSSFPRDKDYTQVCRNINQIKICMETGRTVILLNLENLYESLYDVLNQYYIHVGESRYVDLGLQTHRVKCRVNDNFKLHISKNLTDPHSHLLGIVCIKLIVIAEKKTVYEMFPTPLINRLEKHFVLTSSVLTESQLDVLRHFKNWIRQFSRVTGTSEGQKFTEADAFIGYQNDTPAAVVFQATRQLEGGGLAVSHQRWERTESVNDLAEEGVEDSQVWKENVFKRSQYLLLQTACPDALVRLEHSSLADKREELLQIYFQQHHSSLEEFLAHHVQRIGTRQESLLMQVTTHSHLLSRDELDRISNILSLDQSHVHAFSLEEFDTELSFTNKVSLAFQRRAGDAYHSLLVIQCDSGHLNSDLIACARYRIYDKKAEATLQNEGEGCTHILFIIHLPRHVVGSVFVGFQGDPWISTHIDNLGTTDNTIMLHEAMGMSISQLFYSEATSEAEETPNKAEVTQLTLDNAKMSVGQILPPSPSRIDFDEDTSLHTVSLEKVGVQNEAEVTQSTLDKANMSAGQILPPPPSRIDFDEDTSLHTVSLEKVGVQNEAEVTQSTLDKANMSAGQILPPPPSRIDFDEDTSLHTVSLEKVGVQNEAEVTHLTLDKANMSVGQILPPSPSRIDFDEDTSLHTVSLEKVGVQNEAEVTQLTLDKANMSVEEILPPSPSGNNFDGDTYPHTAPLEGVEVLNQAKVTQLTLDANMSVEEIPTASPSLPPSPSGNDFDGDTYPHTAPLDGAVVQSKAEVAHITPKDAKKSVEQILPPLPCGNDFEGDIPHGPHTASPIKGSHNAQFRRLHGCIQQAASRLHDSAKNKARATERVAILVTLIPRTPSFPPDDSTFHGILVRHIHRLLKEREQVREDERNWVLNEALSIRKLHNGGTFQNVLARKLDDVLVPIFSEIIALVDHDYNLNHLDPKNKNPPVYQFWLTMFRNQQLHYQEMVAGGVHREKVPGAGGRMAEEDFKCQLPFSWQVKAAVDSLWYSAKSTAEGTSRSLHLQLFELVCQTTIGEALGSVDEAYCKELYQYYLHDFVRSVHQCYHRQQKSVNLEYQLISDALNSLVHSPEFDGHESLTGRITALHIVYHFAKPKVFWFGQLVSHLPGIMTTLQDRMPINGSEMVLHLHAVEHALGEVEPPLARESKDKKTVLASWLNQLRLTHNAIDSILNLPSQSELANRARMKWQLIQALQMFVEHVVLKHEGIIPYAKRLQLHLKSDANFLEAKTVERVKNHLNSMDSDLKEKLGSQSEKLTSIRNSCRAFFMELVSTLCFGTHSAPEPSLIEMLINTVFTERQETEVGTREFSPYHEAKSDKVPVIRSFLLQLLLEHNTEKVKEYLEYYFYKSQQAFTDKEVDQNLCLLCIQCFEDALNKEYARKSIQERASRILEEGHLALQQHTGYPQNKNFLDCIEGVAKVRFGLSVAAELFCKHVAMRPALLHAVRDVCTDATINHVDDTRHTDIVGPVIYFLKLIVRQYGFPCLAEISAVHAWVVPLELRRADEEQQMVDPFVIYNPRYSGLRECVSGVLYGKQLKQLNESTKNLHLKNSPLLLLALYEKIALSRASTLPSRKVLPIVLEQLNIFILESETLPEKLKWMARLLVANEQGGTLAQLVVDPTQPLQHRTLGGIMVHTAAVFFCQQRIDILQPFVNMLNNPAALVNAYLPTMPEDYLMEAKRVLQGKFYECPRGHPYFVGECGRPVVEQTCKVCGANIGGIDHVLRHDNRKARSHDTTQTGYSLEMPESRSTVPSPERSLSPATCCIVRALMNSALLWASCNSKNAMAGLTQLVKVDVHPQDLSEFFWCHLERDMELLGTATGKNMDESAIIVHLVLREILLRVPPTSAEVTRVTSLATKDAREQWENIFSNNYIQPVLQSLEERLTEALHNILNDDNQERDKLFSLVYEHMQVAEGSLDPHLWAYRSRITLEHLRQTLQQQNMRKKCPILFRFLQEEPNLRATQYLTDIVQLQQCLFDSFNHLLDRKEARRITIGQFLQSHKDENVRRGYQKMFASLQNAWEQVGDKLRDHARLKVEEKYLLPSFTHNTPLEYLIPTTVGAGACTTALTDFLVLTHNNFIEACQDFIKQYQRKSQWREYKLPITHIHDCHLLIYEQQLPSIILSHCHYSLVVGKGQDVCYDLPALEKHLLDQFIHGKPVILSDIPQVVYQKDIYTAATFAAVRKKVEPQTLLPPHMKQQIIQEIGTPDRLRETLDVVDIVLGFLSLGGGKANQSLGQYVNQTLKMKGRRFNGKAQDCILGHILSLWQTLSVELARQLTLQQQEPFDVESMPKHFREELPTDGDEKEALNHCLRVLDLDNLLGTLFEFIETFVKHSPANEKEWPLVDTLEVFLERNALPAIKNFRDEFPETITLAQAVAVWKHIVWYQNRLGTHGTM